MGLESGQELDAMEQFESEGQSMGPPDVNVHLGEGESQDMGELA